MHLQTTTDSVEGVGGVTGRDGRELSAGELGGSTQDSRLVLLVGVVSRKGIKESEVDTTVRDDTDDGDTNTVVKRGNTTRLNSLHETVGQTAELLLARSYIRGKTSTGVVERVNNQQRTSTGKTTRGHVDQEELSEFSLLVGLGEDGLDGVLEGKVKGLGREVTDNVGQVTTPESLDTLFLGNADKAVHDTSVTGDFTTTNLGVGILRLDQKLDTLNGSSGLYFRWETTVRYCSAATSKITMPDELTVLATAPETPPAIKLIIKSVDICEKDEQSGLDIINYGTKAFRRHHESEQ